MSSMAATTGGRSFDSDITRWVIEFILRQLQTPVLTITKILTNRHVPLSNTSPRLKKSILLRQIDADIEDGSVSEKTLDAIETVEQIDRNEGDLIMDSMKNAYCAVAVECTVKYMLGNLQRARKGKFLEAVERVWKQRVGGLKREGRSELVTGKLMKCFEEMEVALKDDGVAKRWLKRNTRNEAVEMVRVYLGEAVAVSGPVFVEMVASMEMRGDGGLLCRKRGEGENEGVDVNLGGGEVNGLTENSREGGGGENGVAGVNGGGGRVCVVRIVCYHENSNQSEADAANHFTNQPAVPSIRNEKGKGVDAPNLSANLSKEANAGVASCSHQNNVSKPSLMERNATARTFEWDDSIDDSSEGTGDQMNRIHLDRPKRRAVSPLTSEGTGDQMNRIHLDSPKRRAVSPLKKYELARIAKRRKPKRWSQEEEDALRESVKKYGKGNWKLIWNSRRSVFQERTEVDLKDKWRNMTRYG
ncbi:hypothetical protein OIU77_004975 [Salix suchowensis]|uniref:Uncharacterized protein n=1 Tax=Salix suchowensis TaxID=1278906 RepID=A0ABQ9AW70_9ROSI|nr:hypothetical protein OIU77_004975 [Salix suchowensis]